MPTTDFAKLVPGFDFLQGLIKNAGGGLPNMGQWIAPTFDPAELEKRISELRTVQFWLEQNVRMLAATIQALEVQRMTLSTLKTMNMPLANLRDAMTLASPAPSVPSAASAPSAPSAPSEPEPASRAAPAADKPAAAVDPVQWWTALTQQFTELATSAMQDSAANAAKSIAAVAAQAPAGAADAPAKKAARAAAPRPKR